MGTVVAVCMSTQKGVRKQSVRSGTLVPDHGLEGDAHAGNWHRQISLLSLQKIEDFKKRGALVSHGDFGENLVVSDIDLAQLPIGTRLVSDEIVLEVTQIGKECHTRCAIYHAMDECIMPTQGIFAKVLRGGVVAPGDELVVAPATE